MRNFIAHSVQQNENLITRTQTDRAPFAGGMWGDIPASSVPRNGIAHSIGYMPYPDRLEPIGGSQRYGSAQLPSLPGRTGYLLDKNEDYVTRVDGGNFLSSDVGNYIVWDDGTHDKIVEYLGVSQVRVEDSALDRASFASIRGPIHDCQPHYASGKILLHIDNRLFVANASNPTAWTQCNCISYKTPANADSVILEVGLHWAKVVTTNGIFWVNLTSPYLYFHDNSPIPTTLITDVAQTSIKVYGRRYTYTMSRLSGTTVTRDRTTDGVAIEHETGPCKINGSGKDYGEIYTEHPVGDGTQTYEYLRGGTLYAGWDAPSEWAAVSDAQFKLAINGITTNYKVDFTGVTTMNEVAKRVQTALRNTDPQITFEYIITSGSGYFVCKLPIAGTTMSYTTSGDGGTDIGGTSDGLCMDGCGSIYTGYIDAASTIGTLEIPVDSDDASIHQFHHTHYSIYGSLDVGPNGTDPQTGEKHNTELRVWVADIPVAKAFIASRSGNTVTATAGTFQRCDIGCKLRWQDGTEATITGYTNSTTVTTDTSSTVSSQAAAIGGDNALSKPIRVLTASQSGTTVTRTDGTTFSAADINKTIFWPDGSISHIKSVTDVNTCEVVESQSISSTGACVDPTCRKFTDTISDDILYDRDSAYVLHNRYWEPLPNGDLAAFCNGFFVVANSNDQALAYSQVAEDYEYLTGYHNPAFQMANAKDKVLWISAHTNDLILYCSRSTRGAPINTFDSQKIDEVGEYIAILKRIRVLDPNVGIRARRGICKIKGDLDWVFTSEPAIKFFDGVSYSDNLAYGRLMNKVQEMTSPIGCIYDPFNGVTFWDSTNCYRHAIRPEQGIGMIEIPASYIPQPEIPAGMLVVHDSANNQRCIILDRRDGYFYDITTRNGPGSLVKVWKHKVSANGTGGTEFERRFKLAEDIGNYEHFFLRLLEAHLYIRPFSELNRNQSGYDAGGFPSGLEININWYLDGEPTTPATIIRAIPFTGDLKADKVLIGHRIQAEVVVNRGDHLIAQRQMYYVASNKAAEPDNRIMTEMDYQEELSKAVLWMSYLNGSLINRVTGAALNLNVTAVDGPEGRSGTAAQFAAALTLPAVSLAVAGAVLMWVNGTVAMTIGGSGISLTEHGAIGDWKLLYASGLTKAGAVVLTPTGTARIADLRIFNTAIAAATRTYYYNDVNDNDGLVVLP